ncbi:hypothetical protein ACIQM3_07950 [Streptomyces sp. NPDC091271]|uniref:hypothetical protein n=1 Tax=Streptomyces sp. NPDC091271 TaxID=3365980 RepID=UPI00381B9342
MILMTGSVSIALGMVALNTPCALLGPVLVAPALLAGAGQGMGQLGGLSLLNSAVPPHRLPTMTVVPGSHGHHTRYHRPHER